MGLCDVQLVGYVYCGFFLAASDGTPLLASLTLFPLLLLSLALRSLLRNALQISPTSVNSWKLCAKLLPYTKRTLSDLVARGYQLLVLCCRV